MKYIQKVKVKMKVILDRESILNNISKAKMIMKFIQEIKVKMEILDRELILSNIIKVQKYLVLSNKIG